MRRRNRVDVEFFNPSGTSHRILDNADVGEYLAQTWVKYFAKYTPVQEGVLRSNVTTKPFEVTYESPYAHYQWEGIKYVDPEYGVSGWFNPTSGTWFSRPGITKVPSGEPLHYSKEQNPLATSHWEQAAYDAFKDIVAHDVSNYIKQR